MGRREWKLADLACKGHTPDRVFFGEPQVAVWPCCDTLGRGVRSERELADFPRWRDAPDLVSFAEPEIAIWARYDIAWRKL